VNEFSDSLNDALMSKDMDRFWKSWRSKFGSKRTATGTVIDELCDEKDIADIGLLMFFKQLPCSHCRDIKNLNLNFLHDIRSIELDADVITVDIVAY